MVKFSNKPNMKGIKSASENINRSSKLIGRQGRLWSGLYQTRVSGIGYGLIFAFALCLVIPLIVKLCGM